MKKYLIGLFFLISSFAAAMEVTETSKPEKPNFFYLDSKLFVAVLCLPNDSEEKPNKVLDKTGLASIAWIQKYLKDDNGSDRELREGIVVKALKRLWGCKIKPDWITQIYHGINSSLTGTNIEIQPSENDLTDAMKKEIENLIGLFKDKSDERLSVLQKFVQTYGPKFDYLIHGFEIDTRVKPEKITKKLLCRNYQELALDSQDMPPLVIVLKKKLEAEVDVAVLDNEFPKVCKQASINKIDDADQHVKRFLSLSNEKLVKGSPKYEFVLRALLLSKEAFPIFKRIAPRAEIGKIAVLSAGKEWSSKYQLHDLQKLFYGSGNYKLSEFVLPQSDEIELSNPLYIVWSIGWNDQGDSFGEYRYWVFEVEPMESLDDTFSAKVTLHRRLGDEHDADILGKLFGSIVHLIEEISFF